MRKSKLWVGAAVVPLVAAGQFVAPHVVSAQTPGQAPLSPAQAKSLSTNVTQRVIVVLKDQVAQYSASARSDSARRGVESREQRPILGELGMTKARNVHAYDLLNAVAATVSPGEAKRLAANPNVAEVAPDQIIHLANPVSSAPARTSGSTRTPIPGECQAPGAAPLLAPQALTTISADSQNPNQPTARSLGFDGTGVKVAFIADGLDINNQDFIRANGQHVFVDYKDFSGEGTGVATGGGEAFLDASSVAAQGLHTYDISHYSAEPLSRPCNIRVEGVSPGASLVGLDIFGAEDAGFNSSFLQAIDYAVTSDHVNVLNESLGNNYYPDDAASMDLIKAANDAAVAAGTTVTASSGDAGVTSTIGTPSTDPLVISAGASTTYQGEVQANYGGSQFGVSGWLNDNISSFSSSGFQQDGATISLVAPGELNWALCSTNTAAYFECLDYAGQPTPVQLTGGTSESAPLTAGVAALVDQAYAKTHGGSYPTPAVVKQIITSTADDINAPAQMQASGRIDAYRAVLAAEAYKTTAPAGEPNTLLLSAPQINTVSAAGAPVSLTENVTNQGATSQAVTLSTRQLGAYSMVDTQTVTLSDKSSPKSVDYQGLTDNYESISFMVPAGADRLNASIAYQGASSALSARVRLSLIDPSGRLADYSVPQGIGNYGNAEVAAPEAGRWTAFIFSRDSAEGGTQGPVLFGASVASWQAFGTVSPSSATIPAGGTLTVHVHGTAPSNPGDTAASLVVSPTGQPAQTVPMTFRAMVPTGPTSFGGVLTGGNGRSSYVGQANYYQVNVKAGSPEINASVTLADNPDNQVFTWLIDPSGQSQAFQSNGLVESDGQGGLTYVRSLGANLHVLYPMTGTWTMIVLFAPTVSGTALSEPFTVSLNEAAAKVKASGVPAGSTVSSNHPATVQVHVTNNGTAPEAYFIDGRLDSQASYSLPALNSSSATVPLNVFGNIPLYLVPSQTYGLSATATTSGSEPIQFDLGAPTGDPDVASNQGLSVSASLTGNPVTTGVWDVAPDVIGPFGKTGATQESVSTTLTATAQAFDPGVTTSGGDLWQAALGGPAYVSSVIVQPGQSATIPVILSPAQGEATGSYVSGVIYLDDDSLLTAYSSLAPNANTVAAIPYSYKVG